MIQRGPGAKYRRLIQRINLGLQGWFRRKVNCFRYFTLVQKLYTISFITVGIAVFLTIFPERLGLVWPFVALFALSLAFAAVALGIVVYHRVRRMWGTTSGKIILGLFVAVSSYGADFYGRHEIYKMTGENPEAFTSARIALASLFTPFVWLFVATLFAFLSVAAQILVQAWWVIRWLFGHQSSTRQFDNDHLFGALGLFAFLGFAFGSIAAEIPQIEPFLAWVVWITSFYKVHDTRYATVKPNSRVAFLPGDRLCVGELLPNGKINFRTIKRESALDSKDGD